MALYVVPLDSGQTTDAVGCGGDVDVVALVVGGVAVDREVVDGVEVVDGAVVGDELGRPV